MVLDELIAIQQASSQKNVTPFVLEYLRELNNITTKTPELARQLALERVKSSSRNNEVFIPKNTSLNALSRYQF